MSTVIVPSHPSAARRAAGIVTAGLSALVAACQGDMSFETCEDIDALIAPRSDPEPGRLAGLTAAHNAVRAELGLDPLTWSPEVAAFAQEWADKLAAKGCVMQHRPYEGPDAQKYGENIFKSWGIMPTAQKVVDSWAAEVADYDAIADTCSGVCGHYTQVVWADSQHLGCGMATCDDQEVWVCNYDPPGNIVGEKPY
jgi:uncharacterized protein YkwD